MLITAMFFSLLRLVPGGIGPSKEQPYILYKLKTTIRYKGPSKATSYTLHSAASTGRNALALGRSLSTGNRDARPGKVGARSAKDVDIGTTGRHGSLDVLEGNVLDGDTGSGYSSGRTILVVLLDDNTVLADVLESNARVCDVGDGTGCAVDGLNADTWAEVSKTGDTNGGGYLPFSELTMVLSEIVTPLTTLSERPPTEPIERPCPPCDVRRTKGTSLEDDLQSSNRWRRRCPHQS
jgi:hypothetical protein